MNITPIDDRLVIKPDEPEDKTSSGIYLPEGAKERPMTGKIVSVGPGKLNDDGSRTASNLKKGDTVVYGKYAGTEVEIAGDEHKICRENELLAVIEK